MEPPPPARAEDVFAAWLARRDARDPAGFTALLAAHPEQADSLRDLARKWSDLASVIRATIADCVPPEVIQRLFGATAESGWTGSADESGTAALLRRLAAAARPRGRLRVEAEIGRGGMGAILRVFDEDLRRTMAMKVALGREGEPDHAHVARFLEEAQVTGQLDHPGIVPVHDLGLDDQGRPYFTMKLVRGRDLRTVYDLVFQGREGWTETRAVGAILRACEAVAYAHRKGVVHRDLKPANVMVGDLGEVYVMDWGLARVLGRPDSRDLRLADPAPSRSVRTERREEREETPESPIVTMDGTVVGTPAYMPPEQARGDVDQIDARSDVYAIGAMLYHLLAMRMPYVTGEGRVSGRTILARVLDGPPRRIVEFRPMAPAELVAICEKAMSRDASRRYANTLELADDLRAYLEGRVVHAHEAGAIPELRKWIGRNRGLALAGAAAVLAVVLGLGGMAGVQAARNRDLARANGEIRGLSDVRLLEELKTEADLLWPALPAQVPAMERWLARAEAVVDRRSLHEAVLQRVRGPSTRDLSEPEARWFESAMASLIAEIDAFDGPDRSRGLITDMHGRLETARTIDERTTSGAEARARWHATIDAVRADPRYAGLDLVPRTGLLPLGADPVSGLQEFAHVASGPPATRGADGTLEYADGTGIVLVLVPGGTFAMGAVADTDSPAPDPLAKPAEGPLVPITLDPFYIAKHEMTQAQWTRIAGSNPSLYAVDTRTPPRVGPRNPVERISWDDARTMLARLDLVLPTEAQWEYAARAGTTTPWWTGSTIATIAGAGNLADATSQREGPEHWPHDVSLDDGALVHAPVGSYRANPFGLHDVIGNVGEWCADLFLLGPSWSTPAPGTGARDAGGGSLLRCVRGGAFPAKPEHARSAHRSAVSPTQRLHDTGVRPAAPVR